jgi:hypothetical protein
VGGRAARHIRLDSALRMTTLRQVEHRGHRWFRAERE